MKEREAGREGRREEEEGEGEEEEEEEGEEEEGINMMGNKVK